MIIRHNVPIYKISWLRFANGGAIGTYYEPENIQELKEICTTLYQKGKNFDLIGHTSNIYFLPSYSVDILVSTRKVNETTEEDKYIIADCGVSVSSLARQMVKKGIKGFEGLIDLPGTVAASVYGNASCYGCSINSLLESFQLLTPDCEIKTLHTGDLKLSKRSTSLKRNELGGVIITVTLRKENGDADQLRLLADQCHKRRKTTQPPANDNLGSIYSNKHELTPIGFVIKGIAKIIATLYGLTGQSRNKIKKKQQEIMLILSGGKELIPYVYSWNRYIWKDERSHELFWKFHHIHKKLFKESNFEIEIKGKI